MYTSLAWVPRGVAQAKINADPDLAAAAALAADAGDAVPVDPADARKQNGASSSQGAGSGPSTSAAAADGDTPMEGATGGSDDDDELDMADVLANDLDALTFYPSNADDPVLAGGALGAAATAAGGFDPDELEDLEIRPTDALLVSAKSGEEASTLEFHLFDDILDEANPAEYVPNVYVHHDLVLPAIPLCAAFSAVRSDELRHNLVAVGLFTPGIDVWDADQVNALLPVQRLGGYEKTGGGGGGGRGRKKKKGSSKKARLRLREGSHSDAVMALSWNKVQTEYLASASADKTVKVWDVESAHCACTMKHHTDKVQAVAFHPGHADVLLTGAFDQTAAVVDVRTQTPAQMWKLGSDVESAHWVQRAADAHALVATEDGRMHLFDRRSAEAMAVWQAHEGAASACAVSQDVPGLVVTGSVDKRVKVWDVLNWDDNSRRPKLVLETPSRVGAVFAAALCPILGSDAPKHTSPLVLATGGQRGKVNVVDLGVKSQEIREHFKGHFEKEAFEVMEARAKRTRPGKAGKGAQRMEEERGRLEVDSDDDDEEDEDSDSSDHEG